MESRFSLGLMRVLAGAALVSGLALGVQAQGGDPDPNSPTPILLSHPNSTRVLAHQSRWLGRMPLENIPQQAFQPGQRIVVYATNLQPMEGEAANAYRVWVVDRQGRQYRFPVLHVTEVPGYPGVHAIILNVQDEINFWPGPAADGDVLIYLSNRGLASNRVKLGVGTIGGEIAEAPNARPTPLGTTAKTLGLKNPNETTESRSIGYRFANDRKRFLEQATFGPTAALDARLQRVGLRTWLAEQFNAPYPSVSNPYPNDPLKPINAPGDCNGNNTPPDPVDVPATCFRDTYTMYRPQTWFFKEAFYGDAQLRHRVAWALSQIWVTSGFDVQQGRHMIEYHKVLSNHAFGNYRDLMRDMTLNPAMGQYLDMAISTRTSPNENYAREIMQLFTIGLFMLNPDGTLQLNQSGEPIPTYTQDGVNNLTKVLTGWTFCNPAVASCPNSVAGTVNYIDPMALNVGSVANPRHDLSAKVLLSYPGSMTTNIAACTGTCDDSIANITAYANASMAQALDNMFHHPNVGPFVSKILIQHLVTSNPTPAYVQRVAAAFNNNGLGVRGDMKAVIKAILLDPEARGDEKTDPNFGKLREPVLFLTNFARHFGARSASGTDISDGNFVRGRAEFNNMAQVPFMSPTVFNFYPPDYGIPGTALLGPEFAIMTTGTAIARASFINRLTFVNSPAGTPPYPAPFPVSGVDTPNGTSFDFADLVALSTADSTGGQLVDELNRRMLHGTMSVAMRNSILTAVNAFGSSGTAHESRVRQAVYLVASSSQFQVQR